MVGAPSVCHVAVLLNNTATFLIVDSDVFCHRPSKEGFTNCFDHLTRNCVTND